MLILTPWEDTLFSWGILYEGHFSPLQEKPGPPALPAVLLLRVVVERGVHSFTHTHASLGATLTPHQVTMNGPKETSKDL